MIAQIYVEANSKEIAEANAKLQEFNGKLQIHNKLVFEEKDVTKKKGLEADMKKFMKSEPKIPASVQKETKLLLDVENITFAFVNGQGTISIKYETKYEIERFYLVYSLETWRAIEAEFERRASKIQ